MATQMAREDQTPVFQVVDEINRDDKGVDRLVAWAELLVKRGTTATNISGAVNLYINPSLDMNFEAY